MRRGSGDKGGKGAKEQTKKGLREELRCEFTRQMEMVLGRIYSLMVVGLELSVYQNVSWHALWGLIVEPGPHGASDLRLCNFLNFSLPMSGPMGLDLFIRFPKLVSFSDHGYREST